MFAWVAAGHEAKLKINYPRADEIRKFANSKNSRGLVPGRRINLAAAGIVATYLPITNGGVNL